MRHDMLRKNPCTLALAALLIMAAGPALAIDIPDSPEGTVTTVATALADYRPEVIWQALPASYQKDITELTHTFAAKMDPKVWEAAFGLGRRTTGILRDKKQFILASSIMKSAATDRQRVEESWDSVVGMLDSFFSSEVSKLDALKKIDWERYLATTVRDMMKRADDGAKKRGDDSFDREFTDRLRGLKVEVLSRDGDRANLRMTSPDEEPEEIELARVEGRWVPAQMADEWQGSIAEAKQKLAAMSAEEIQQGSMQAMMLIGMADGMLSQLEAVQSAEQFDQALQGILGPFFGGMLAQSGEMSAPIAD